MWVYMSHPTGGIMQTSGEIIVELARKFQDGKSFVYRKKVQKRGFVIHHLRYRKGCTVRRSEFPKGEKGRDEYHRALKPFYMKYPYDYIIIMNGTHTRIDHPKRGLSRMKRDNFGRLVLAVLLTEK